MSSRFSLVLICFFGLPLLSLAQFDGSVFGQTLSITLSPQYPNPGETVTATIDDYSLGGGGGEISWKIDGVEPANSTNQRSVSFLAGSVGTPSTISAKLAFQNGQIMTAERTIVPYFVDVIIEPFTYTPHFYRGRALPVNDSTVFLTALIHDKDGLVSPGNYSYNWQHNGKVINGGSMKGAYKTRITIPYGSSSRVILSVSDATGSIITRKVFDIPTVEVDLQFYELSSLYGLSQRAINDEYRLLGNSVTVRAVPYNLDRYSISSGLVTEWKVDGRREASNGTDPFEITLRRGSGDYSRVEYKVQHTSKFLQRDTKGFSVRF